MNLAYAYTRDEVIIPEQKLIAELPVVKSTLKMFKDQVLERVELHYQKYLGQLVLGLHIKMSLQLLVALRDEVIIPEQKLIAELPVVKSTLKMFKVETKQPTIVYLQSQRVLQHSVYLKQ
jgi:D-alanyl-D-alanine carboxypeptidase (penicillin-binding protein 5/6)